MGRVTLAETAVLLHLDPVGMRLLILCGIIVAVLALRAGQCDSRTHDSTSLYGIKKKDLVTRRQLKYHTLRDPSNTFSEKTAVFQ